MNRRELFQKSFVAAGALCVLPSVFNLTASALAGASSWTQTPTASQLLEVIKPSLQKYNQDRKIATLTANEWYALGTNHQALWTYHAEIGNLHKLDLAVQANQAYLKTKYGAAAVDYMLQNGSYAIFTKMSAGMHEVSAKLRTGWTVNPAISCGGFWSGLAIAMAIAALLVTVPELVIAFSMLGIMNDGMGMYLCD